MNYKEYSYPKRNMKFIKELMEYIKKTCGINENDRGLSIGSEDNAHEEFLPNVDILNDKNIYNAEKDKMPLNMFNKFDYVFIKSVIEHIWNTDLFLSEIYRVLKPGGKVIILTPDYQKQKSFFYDDYTHIKPFTLTSLKMAVLLNNFRIGIAKHFYYYKKIREGYWLTEKTGIKYFRWGSDRQLFVVGIK
jgi:SAM-dependent methyltransferase